MSRAALDRYQRAWELAVGRQDEYERARLELLWYEAADRFNAEYDGDIYDLTSEEYTVAIAELIDWSPR